MKIDNTSLLYISVRIIYIIDILNLFKSVCSEKSTIKFSPCAMFINPYYNTELIDINVKFDSMEESMIFDTNILRLLDYWSEYDA